jgi:hypothetical protein
VAQTNPFFDLTYLIPKRVYFYRDLEFILSLEQAILYLEHIIRYLEQIAFYRGEVTMPHFYVYEFIVLSFILYLSEE